MRQLTMVRLLTCPCVVWTTPVDRVDSGYFVSPRATCNNDGMSDYILPKLLRSPGGQAPHVYSPPDNVDKRLKESKRER